MQQSASTPGDRNNVVEFLPSKRLPVWSLVLLDEAALVNFLIGITLKPSSVPFLLLLLVQLFHLFGLLGEDTTTEHPAVLREILQGDELGDLEGNEETEQDKETPSPDVGHVDAIAGGKIVASVDNVTAIPSAEESASLVRTELVSAYREN